jgi:enoyl-CoA hydratase/carnithine racemase
VVTLADGEFDDLLRSPFAPGELGGRADGVAIVVSPGGTVGPVAAARVAALPAVVIANGHDPADPPAHADVVVDAAVATVDDVLATVEATPIAATTLAVLLRGAPYRDTATGLAVESAAYSTLQAGPEFARWRAGRARRTRKSNAAPVRVERAGPRLTVTLDRPDVRNALDVAMRDALLDAFALAGADDGIADVVMRGAGPSFCAGGDLDEFGSFEDPASAHLARLAASVGLAIDAVSDRTTVQMHGACAGSGVELAAFARIVIAAPDTTFALPEVGFGLVPGAGGTVSIVRRAGRHRTALLALAGRPIDVATALVWGLIDRVGDAEMASTGADR